jgi:S-adenosylmethionine-dependent methyltransferase
VLTGGVVDVFSDQLDAWLDYTESPWGRIRYAVVEQILRREAAGLGDRLRILDVGGGDGRDALPLALAGHDVTILDQSAAWLAEARRRAEAAGVQVVTVVGDLSAPPPLGQFDLVLCHFVLQYRSSDADDLARLAAYTRAGGLVSVMVPNPASMVLRQLVTEGPEAALTELGAGTKLAVTFDHEVRKIPMGTLEEAMSRAGLLVARRYGTRIANDLLTSNQAKSDPDYFAGLLKLELALCDQEPFIRVGAMYQLVATRA